MKKFLLAILAAAALTSAALANEFTFAQAGVKITVPNGYTLLQRSEIDQLYPPTRGPGFVIGNAARSVTISYDLSKRYCSVRIGLEYIFHDIRPPDMRVPVPTEVTVLP